MEILKERKKPKEIKHTVNTISYCPTGLIDGSLFVGFTSIHGIT